MSNPPTSQLIIYQTEDGQTRLKAQLLSFPRSCAPEGSVLGVWECI